MWHTLRRPHRLGDRRAVREHEITTPDPKALDHPGNHWQIPPAKTAGCTRESLKWREVEPTGVDGWSQGSTIMHQAVEVRWPKQACKPVQHLFCSTNGYEPIMHQDHILRLRLPYHRMIMPRSTHRHAANLLELDFLELAPGFHTPVPIIDIHTHLSGTEAVRCYRDIAAAYGITLTYSMTPFPQVEAVREVMGNRVQFIAIPDYENPDRRHAHGPGFLDRIRAFHQMGARIVKFWAAPRGRDFGEEAGDASLDTPARRRAMDLAAELDMVFMVHVADPDTWFNTKYSDAQKYGTKLEQYEPLEQLLATYQRPWIAAHMGGWPEDLDFLDALLERHPNLHLDTSATKWMVRELSKHPRERLVAFFQRWQGRILFGSDIVTREEHMTPGEETADGPTPQATSPEEARDLYASRYWALRTMFETSYDGPSPIADPDLMMTEPSKYGPLDSPKLRGKALPADLLQSVYHDAAMDLLATFNDPAAAEDARA